MSSLNIVTMMVMVLLTNVKSTIVSLWLKTLGDLNTVQMIMNHYIVHNHMLHVQNVKVLCIVMISKLSPLTTCNGMILTMTVKSIMEICKKIVMK